MAAGKTPKPHVRLRGKQLRFYPFDKIDRFDRIERNLSMNFIEARLQEMCDEARNELITRIAVHEAGHAVMMLLLTRRAPYHVILTPETGTGMTVPIHFPDSGAERALIMMAGYAAEKLYDSPEEDTSLGDYMLHDDYDNQDFLNMCRDETGLERLPEDFFVLHTFYTDIREKKINLFCRRWTCKVRGVYIPYYTNI